ncbi:hypothetical protein [Ruminiclostridium cellobioparum]|uniref:hypothetical protein n=1 Tax=Ruminiclostridium cellobioparum TaxID=29355 RepID=UPI00068497D2|nr:hypothetical protein [Ruminiclostridium cellobioparum]
MSLTNLGLVEHCKKALNEKWGYVYGTFGTVLTEPMLQSKLKQYPDNVRQYESFIRSNWLGKRSADCVGLIKSYLWWTPTGPVYNSKTDKSANGMYEAAKEKGMINTIPETPGMCVRKDQHIGVYIGNGLVIESKGTKYGVVQTPLTGVGATAWTHWIKCPYIEYEVVDELKEALEYICPKAGIDFNHWYLKAKEIKYLDIVFKNIYKAWR